jgi:hypothetical protein
MEPLENALNAVGLRTPVMRFVAGAGVTGGILWGTKPALFFDASGNPRPWSLLETGPMRSETATILPWYVAASAIGLWLGAFI